ncbi:hypothetical protein E2R68_04090 [Psychromonas sp. RZ22]|uniref:hypothetical protein n=1 Tax=Psychromonas algarum TaxID=2555643 RepID=UPI0010683EDF|nr:hypothetical protein [Psychromonas sp. RZ22]TEW55576.1 hypothetical protein E2R68_04090 [Psychromonas sp. RZ22]
MFKKSTLLASILLVSACSNTATTNYVDDVVASKTENQDYVEVVGKDIIPVDLLELNLSLKISVLSVTAKIDPAAERTQPDPVIIIPAKDEMALESDKKATKESKKQSTADAEKAAADAQIADQEAPVNPNADKNISTVNFQIDYTVDKNKIADEEFTEYNVALVDGTDVDLSIDQASQSCDDIKCTVSQTFSFPVSTVLLEKSVRDGLYFSLLQTTKNEQLTLETMIPGRYITALLAE